MHDLEQLVVVCTHCQKSERATGVATACSCWVRAPLSRRRCCLLYELNDSEALEDINKAVGWLMGARGVEKPVPKGRAVLNPGCRPKEKRENAVQVPEANLRPPRTQLATLRKMKSSTASVPAWGRARVVVLETNARDLSEFTRPCYFALVFYCDKSWQHMYITNIPLDTSLRSVLNDEKKGVQTKDAWSVISLYRHELCRYFCCEDFIHSGRI